MLKTVWDYSIGIVLDGLKGIGKNYLFEKYKQFIDPDPALLRMGVEGEKIKIARDLFFPRTRVAITPGRSHHGYRPGQFHPDDKWAFNALAQVAEQLSSEHVEEKGPPPHNIGGSFICTGDPVSNAWSRKFLQYRYIDDDKPELGMVRKENPNVIAPFRLDLTPWGKLGDQPSAWSIYRNQEMIEANAESDLLVIWKMPNWIAGRRRWRLLTRQPQESVVIFGGRRGVGTAATRNLLESYDILKSLTEVSRKYEYWQAIIKVGEVRPGVHPVTQSERLVPGSGPFRVIDHGEVRVRKWGE